jgi:hypothetical protein
MARIEGRRGISIDIDGWRLRGASLALECYRSERTRIAPNGQGAVRCDAIWSITK